MNPFNKISLTAVLLATGLNAQAQELGAMGFAAAAGASTGGYSGSMIDTSYGTTPYQTHHEVSDLLGAVAADVTAQLERFLDQALQRETREVEEERPAEREVVSAY